MRWAVGLALVLVGFQPVAGAETILYRAQWGRDDPWTASRPTRVGRDPKLGPTFTFTGSVVSPRLPAAGGHRLRFRYHFRKTGGEVLWASVTQYSAGKVVPGNFTLQSQHPPIPDLSPVELGLLTEPPTDAIEFRLSVGESSAVTIGAFTVADLGPLPPGPVDSKELLPDPGWERYAPHTALEPENSYFQGPGWMGWLRSEALVITRTPERVRTGRQALLLRTGEEAGGFRYLPAFETTPDAWYDFSVWARGEGVVGLYILVGGPYGDFFTHASGEVLLSPDQWRQLHFPYCTANPAHKGFTVGVLGRGRISVDDLSVRRVAPDEARRLRTANARWSLPPALAQTVPPGETRSPDPVALENAFLRAVLSPMGGGHIVELIDKEHQVTWKDLRLARLDFPNQPVPILWNLPFRTARSVDGRQVTFSHTVTGGEAAVFLDGVRIDQTFRLGPRERRLDMTFRLTNTSRRTRLPNPAVGNAWSAASGLRRLTAPGEEGLLVTDKDALHTRNLVQGWMAASSEAASLVMGFDVTAVHAGRLDPSRHTAGWSYLRLALPPAGSWQTRAWVAPAPLPAVDYADETAVVRAEMGPAGPTWTLRLAAWALEPSGADVTARVIDYGGRPVTVANAGAGPVSFTPPADRLITVLSWGSRDRACTVELFNDPRARTPQKGIEGSGQVQYRPTVPARVLRLPDVADQLQRIASSRTVLWARGLYWQYYPLQSVLQQTGLKTESLDWAAAFPEEVEELLAYRAVILCNLGAAHLSALSRAALGQYVRAGGRLLVLGGSLALGNARSAGTDLEDLLPVTLGGPFEVQPCPGDGQVLRPEAGSFLADLAWNEGPRLYWSHRVKPRAEASVFLWAGQAPILMEGAVGRGRTILFAGTVEGEPGPGELPAWQWSAWSALWERIVARLIR